MHHILILGSGNIGTLVAGLLADSGDYQVILADLVMPIIPHALSGKVQQAQCDIYQPDQIDQLITTHHVQTVVSCLPFHCNTHVAKLALAHALNYFDLTEDVHTTKAVCQLAANGNTIFAPQCGLAPGFISIVAQSLLKQFEQVNRVRMRVGALPLNVSNAIQYCLTWSTDGLINEYGNPCPVLQNGHVVMVPPLEDLEEIKLDGLTYEAFHTSGGIGSLPETYAGKVRTMDYKTIRYPGHCEKMRFLMNGLKLNDKREILKQILEDAIPQTKRDVVLVYVSVQGVRHGRLMEENYAEKFYPQALFGQRWSAIQMTTASSLCVSIDLCVHEKHFTHNVLKQEDIDLHRDFLPNRFGHYFHVER